MAYAHRYAFTRNPAYGAFDEIGGDCANFVSQCLFAGGYPVRIAADGWYYRSFDDRAPAWTGVFFLRRYLLSQGAKALPPQEAAPGDVAFLGFLGDGAFTHSALIVDRAGEQLLVAAHTVDSDYRPLSSYAWRDLALVDPAPARVGD